MSRLALLLPLWLLPLSSFGQNPDIKSEVKSGSYWIVGAAAGFGQDVLGSEDVRRGGTYSLGFAKPEPALKWRGNPAQVVYTGYYMFTKGAGYESRPVDHLHTYGFMANARYWNRWLGPKIDSFLDLGFGLAYSNNQTTDLSSNFHTTPMVGIGIAFPGHENILLTVRWYHASNGGTTGNNQGLNQIQYGISMKF